MEQGVDATRGRDEDSPDPHRRAIWVLGLGGLIPFVALTALLVFGADETLASVPQLVPALSGYAAVILSFLGGIRWGAALTARSGYLTLPLSVVPSIFGWLFLFLPTPWVFAAFAGAFLIQGGWDVVAVRKGQLPRSFGPLRIVLTAVVALSMTAAFVATV